jgi:hypothetical protein
MSTNRGPGEARAEQLKVSRCRKSRFQTILSITRNRRVITRITLRAKYGV